MNKTFKAILSATVALIFAFTALPLSLVARAATQPAAAPQPTWTVPEGYNAHDYNKCVEFLEQTDENGIKNGEKLHGYDPNDPATWRGFTWTAANGEQRISVIDIWAGWDGVGSSFAGILDVSDCIFLKRLHCPGYSSYNGLGIATLNISGCIALESLYCSGNALTELDVSSCTALRELNCSGNALTELDVSRLTLSKLNCSNNLLTELDESSLTTLSELNCSNNLLTELDESSLTRLYYLYCSNNALTELDVSGLTRLYELNCSNNALTELNVSGLTSLYKVDCSNNALTELNVSGGLTSLYELYCSNNALTELDVSGLTSLYKVDCTGNPLTEFVYDIVGEGIEISILAEGNGYIGYLFDYYDHIPALAYTHKHVYAYPINGSTFEGFYDENGSLLAEGEWDGEGYFHNFAGFYHDEPILRVIARFTDAQFEYNQYDYTKCVDFLEQTDANGVKNGTKLNENYDPNDPTTFGTGMWWRVVNGEKRIRHMGFGDLKNRDLVGVLDLSGCTALLTLDCTGNKLTGLNVSGCSALLTLDCTNNSLATLDLSGCIALKNLYCSSNDLIRLDVSGCTSLIKFDCEENPLKELDLGADSVFPFDFVAAEGNGYIGCYVYLLYPDDPNSQFIRGNIYAYPSNGATFEGFYDENGTLIFVGNSYDNGERYEFQIDYFEGSTIIARFSGGYPQGDASGDGKVEMSDAIIALRAALRLVTLTDEQVQRTDMNGDGFISVTDALMILHVAMNLA